MDLYIVKYEKLDGPGWIYNVNRFAVIDNYRSFIWTKRYAEFGDCELYVEATTEMLNMFKIGDFLQRNDDDMTCRIESIELQTDEEEGNYLVITGVDCRAILNQRIVWEQTNFSGTAGKYIEKLIEDAFSSKIIGRAISNLYVDYIIEEEFPDEITQQVTYDNLGEKVIEICKMFGYGSKMIVNELFKFKLYKGVDRSYEQNKNKFVIFSPNFDNIKTSKYLEDFSNFKSVALVGGEGEGVARTCVTVGTATGLNRREIFVDADNISNETEEGVQVDYNETLRNKGLEVLAEHKINKIFDGEVEPNNTYKFKTDYDLGDIVQVINEYGIGARARVIEVIESFDENGYTLIPSFEYMGD